MNSEKESQKFIYKKSDIDFAGFISRLLKKWYWFLISGVIGISIAYLIYEFNPPKYKVATTIILRDGDSKQSVPSIFDSNVKGSKSSLINQIGILRSYRLSEEAIKNLNWRYSWYHNEVFKMKDLYGNFPFHLIPTEGFDQQKNLKIEIKQISDIEYSIKVDSKLNENDPNEEHVTFSETVKFEELFENEYFSFKLFPLNKSPFDRNSTFTLIFNDRSALAYDFQGKIQVNLVDEDSDLIYIKIEGDHIRRHVDYLNELTKVYIQYGLNQKNDAATTTINFIDRQLASITDSLGQASDNFTSFRSKNKIIDLGIEAESIAEKTQKINKEIDDVNLKLRFFLGLEQYLKNNNNTGDLIIPSYVGETDPAINNLVIKLGELYNQREVLSFSVQKGNAKLTELDTEISYTKKILEANLKNQLENTRIELQSLEERKLQANQMMTKLPKMEQDFINFKRRFDHNDELYTYLTRKRAETGIIKASNSPDASILDFARIDAATKTSLKLSVTLAVGCILGVGISFLAFFFIEFYNNKIQNINEIEENISTPVVGKLSIPNADVDSDFVLSSSQEQALRDLRFNIYEIVNHDFNKIISLHSQIDSDDKSIISNYLAIVMAKNNKNVVLIDADMKKQFSKDILKYEPSEIGLTSYFEQDLDLKSIIFDTEMDNLKVIPSGPVHEFPSDIYRDVKITKLVDELKAKFDYILINTPARHGLIFGRYSDANVFTFEVGKTTKEQLLSFHKISLNKNAKNIVALINNPPS